MSFYRSASNPLSLTNKIFVTMAADSHPLNTSWTFWHGDALVSFFFDSGRATVSRLLLWTASSTGL